MNKNIGVIGCGYWGKNLVRNFYELNSLCAICDIDEDCACSDCEDKKSVCDEGWVCQDGVCVEGLAVGSCKQYCSYLGYSSDPSGCALNCGGGCSGTCESGGDEYCSSPTSYCCCVS